MIKKILIDSDVILDVATGRIPFVTDSKKVLVAIEKGKAIGCVSSNCITNIYYILRKLANDKKARSFIGEIVKYLLVLPITQDNIVKALDPSFKDYEDSVQYQCALSNGCEYIVTRNVEDYEKSKLNVYLPNEYIALLGK